MSDILVAARRVVAIVAAGPFRPSSSKAAPAAARYRRAVTRVQAQAVHVCVRVRACACVRVCVCACVCARVWAVLCGCTGRRDMTHTTAVDAPPQNGKRANTMSDLQRIMSHTSGSPTDSTLPDCQPSVDLTRLPTIGRPYPTANYRPALRDCKQLVTHSETKHAQQRQISGQTSPRTYRLWWYGYFAAPCL